MMTQEEAIRLSRRCARNRVACVGKTEEDTRAAVMARLLIILPAWFAMSCIKVHTYDDYVWTLISTIESVYNTRPHDLAEELYATSMGLRGAARELFVNESVELLREAAKRLDAGGE